MADLPDQVMSCAHFQQVDRKADEYWDPYRRVGYSHIEYFVSRHYGQGQLQMSRPLNLVAQHVKAYMPKLVPSRIAHYPEPRRAGLELEALVVKRLLERDDEEQDLIETVYEPVIMEPFFYPLSATYTGLRPSNKVMDQQGMGEDAGEPFITHIPFWQWACDPFAIEFRARSWERHRYRVSREWLLQSPAFAHLDPDTLAKIPAWEDTTEGRGQFQWLNSQAPLGGSANSMDPTVELINVVFYRHDCVIEATCTPQGRGPQLWLRAIQYSGPEGGPYDHLTYQGVPGLLSPVALLNFTRDIAENADALARKNQWSALNSKIVMCYQSGAEDEAKALMENPHASMLNVDDPGMVKTHEMQLLSPQSVAMQEQMVGDWDEAAGSVKQLSQGERKGQRTATQADISNARVGEQVQYLVNKVNRLATKHARKRAWYFQTDPNANFVVDVRGGDGTTVELSYVAEHREGGPDDFSIKAEGVGGIGSSPDTALRRALEVMGAIGQNLPLFQMGLFDIGQFLRFAQRKGIDGLDEFSGDISMVQERMMAARAAENVESVLEGEAPAGGLPGSQVPQPPPPGTGGKNPATAPAASMAGRP